jgi:hypothetical protein
MRQSRGRLRNLELRSHLAEGIPGGLFMNISFKRRRAKSGLLPALPFVGFLGF